MYKVILVLLILAFSATSASARHRWHRYHSLVPYSYIFPHNDAIGRPGPYRSEGSRSELTPPPASSHDSIGGVIPPDDHEALYEAGASAIFGPGTVISDAALKLLSELSQRLGFAT